VESPELLACYTTGEPICAAGCFSLAHHHSTTLLASYTEQIDQALTDCLAEFTTPAELYQPVQYLFEAGGKRVRPIICLLACEAGGGNRANAMSAAIAIELLHTFTLMHDDIMDRSPMRRGRPTVHVKYNENTAILSGDVMIGMAMRMLERSAELAPQPIRVIQAFTTGLIEVCEGQSMDMTFMERHDVTVDEYFTMIDKKTAKLLEMSAAIGVLIAGGSDAHLHHLTTFMREIGIAFQMQDDLLDLAGSPAFGKAPGGDLLEGKRTWMVLRMRDLCQMPSAQTGHRTLIESFFAKNGLVPDQVPAMTAALTEIGVLAEAEQKIRSITEEAFQHLYQLPASPAREALATLAHRLMSRTN
jgi:geranylgeranyl diphosphate synthase type II